MTGARASAPKASKPLPVGAAFLCAANGSNAGLNHGRMDARAAPSNKETMMSHKFSLRQMVRLTRPAFSDNRASSSGIYEVTRLMPADQTGEFSYRVKSSGAGERAVRESEITAGVSRG
jgi:hypothetical protein